MKLSATKLGKMIGLSGEEVNKKLASLGYLEGVPGDWGLTEKGKQFNSIAQELSKELLDTFYKGFNEIEKEKFFQSQ